MSDVTVADGAVSYTYLAKSLPVGVDTAYAQVEERYSDFVNFTDAMNMEIVKITGLAEGMYDLAFDGISLGEYSAKELSEGVNIAVNPQNPGQIAAKAIIDSYLKNLYDIQRVRIFEIVESNLKNAGMFYGKTQEQIFEWVEANEVNYKNSFINNYPNKDTITEKVNNIKKTAIENSKPVAHNVTVTPVTK